MEKRLDHLFRNKLSKLEETPSPGAWDQIHDKLHSKRKAVWIKRLSIAASVLLIATVGFFGYRSVTNLNVPGKDRLVSASQNDAHSDHRTDAPDGEQDIDRNIINDKGSLPKPEHTRPKLVDAKDNNESIKYIDAIESTYNFNDDNEPVTTDGMNSDNRLIITPFDQEIPDVEEKNNLERSPVSNSSPRVKRDDTGRIENHKKVEKKVYPKIKIIYKANENSKLVASGKENILDKGLNKITQFSDEHLLTAERRTKLRNTKDDLLALNFGKLLNKSNRDLENN